MARAETRKRTHIHTKISLVLIIVLAATVYFQQYRLSSAQKRFQQLEHRVHTLENNARSLEVSELRQEIQAIGELAAAQYLYTDAGRFSNQLQIQNVNIPLTDKTFIIKWDGKIKAGVSIEDINIRIQENDRQIMISIPPAEILSHEIMEDSVETLDERNGLFNKITIDDVNAFLSESKTAMEQRAIASGLLSDAEKNITEMIRNILQGNQVIRENYHIIIDSAESSGMAFPENPTGEPAENSA